MDIDGELTHHSHNWSAGQSVQYNKQHLEIGTVVQIVTLLLFTIYYNIILQTTVLHPPYHSTFSLHRERERDRDLQTGVEISSILNKRTNQFYIELGYLTLTRFESPRQ